MIFEILVKSPLIIFLPMRKMIADERRNQLFGDQEMALSRDAIGDISTFNASDLQPGERVIAKTIIGHADPALRHDPAREYTDRSVFAKTGQSLWIVSASSTVVLAQNARGEVQKVSMSRIRSPRKTSKRVTFGRPMNSVNVEMI
jgi:hypothetical protein